MFAEVAQRETNILSRGDGGAGSVKLVIKPRGMQGRGCNGGRGSWSAESELGGLLGYLGQRIGVFVGIPS